MFNTLAPGIAAAGNVIQDWNQDRRDASAREWQEKMVNQANAYNSPVAQRNRMIAAGFNPNLLAGQPMEGFASAPSASQGSRPSSFDDVASTLIQMYQGLSSAEVNQAQARALEASEHKTNVESDLLLRGEGRTNDEFLYGKGLRPVQEQRAENAETRAQNADRRAEDDNARQQGIYDFEATLREAHRRVADADAEAAESNARMSSARASRIEEIIKSELDSARQSRAESRSRSSLLDSQKDLTDNQKKELDDTLEMMDKFKKERLEAFQQQIKNGKRISNAQVLAAEENAFAIAAKSKFLRDRYMVYDKRTKTWYVPLSYKSDFEKAVFGSNWLSDLATAQNIYERD